MHAHVCKKEGLGNSLGIQWLRLPKALVQPLIEDLRCHKICGTAKKKGEREYLYVCIFVYICVYVYGNVGINSFMCVCVCCGNRTGKGYLFRAHYNKGVNHHHLHLVETQMERAMAPHSSTLAWKIPWTEEPGRLQSVGSPRVGHD